MDKVVREVDAFVADEDPIGAGHDLAHGLVGLVAERAMDRVLHAKKGSRHGTCRAGK
jgi:hypothetical protein